MFSLTLVLPPISCDVLIQGSGSLGIGVFGPLTQVAVGREKLFLCLTSELPVSPSFFYVYHTCCYGIVAMVLLLLW